MTENKMGRPTKYDQQFSEQVFLLCKLGATDKELADFFNICEATLNNWKINHPEFLESLKEGKDFADRNVQKKLFERATGYSHSETKIITHAGKVTEVIEFERHYPPDTTACIFWLKNRKPKQWREKFHQELSGVIGFDQLEQGRKRAHERNKPSE